MRLKQKTPRLFAACLILNLAGACATRAPAPITPLKFDADWAFIDVAPNDTRACLKQDDVIRLRELLIRAGSCDTNP